jgi:RecB family exonuclease
MYGKIDRIDTIDDQTIRIVDYKTGKVLTNPDSKSQDTLLRQWRHRLQLGFYVLLIKQQKSFATKRIQTQIIQLDATSADHLYLDYEFDDAELARIEQLALAVYKRIKTLDIPDVTTYDPTLKGITAFETYLLK